MSRKRRQNTFSNIVVTDTGAKGRAIAKAPDGRVIFLQNAVPGDVVDVKTFKARKAYYEGRAVFFHKYSNKRTDPICEHFGVCGGCKWQHMAYEHQLFYKQKEIIDNLKRIAGIDLPEPITIVRSEKQYFYRNKMEFSFSNRRWLTEEDIASHRVFSQTNALGLHIPNMWDKVLDLKACHLQKAPSDAIRNAIKQFAIDNNLGFFDAKKRSGFLRSLMIRTANTGEIMVLVQFLEDIEIKRQRLLDFIADTFPEVTSLQYAINKKENDTIYDQEIHCYKGKDHIFEEMEGLRFKINAKSFYQTNSNQAFELYKIVRRFSGLTGCERVYDLYTGAGTIAQFIAKQAKEVIGIESVRDAVVAAKENATLNNINNVSFFAGDIKHCLDRTFIAEHGHPDLIITDPPRDGMHKNVVQQLLDIAPKKIVYVSCNSATQARDLKLMNPTYQVTKMQAVDMFPQTFHIENVVLLERRSNACNAVPFVKHQ